ncbi:MAG: septum formation initiator family protein [Patescibacteria group bacterium]|nr:septum formation initiator family protein [Patescibacteria group bacterium]
MGKKVIFLGIAVLLLGLFYNLGKQVYDSLAVGGRIDQEKENLVKLQQQNVELKKRLSQVGTVQFIEEQARDKLNQARPGETVMVIPQEELSKVLGAQQKKIEQIIPNWQQWLKLFFP